MANTGAARILIAGWALLAAPGLVRAAADSTPEHHGSDLVAEYNVPVRMSDGVELSTDIYRPVGDRPVATILTRNPYGNGSEQRVRERAHAVAAAGLAYIYQDVRGRFDSGGQWVPFANEGRDGNETIEWIARQPWSDGRVLMEGGSYMALVQWLAAAWHSPHLVAMMPHFSPLALYEDSRRGGVLELTRVKWATMMEGHTRQDLEYDWPRILRSLPVVEMDRAANHQVLPFWREMVGQPEKDSVFWSQADATPALEGLELPTLVASGWYDAYLQSSLLGFTGSDGVWNADGPERARRLVIGPWRHGGSRDSKTGAVDYGPQGAMDLDAMNLRFAAHVLGGERAATPGDDGLPAPVRLFVMGENRWRDEREWPLARAKPTPFYFASAGRANTLGGDGLLTWKQSSSATPDHFVFDPLDPVPTHGGNLPGASPDEPPGAFDQREVEQRKDVLVYTSEPVTQALEVTGPLEVVLWASTDGRDTDFTAKLVDVAPDGTAINLADGAVRARYRESLTSPTLIEPGAVNRYRIDLVATSNVFLPGHRVRVEISSSNFPRFSRNPNTGEPPELATKTRPAAQTVYHDAQRPSHIVLPVVPRKASG